MTAEAFPFVEIIWISPTIFSTNCSNPSTTRNSPGNCDECWEHERVSTEGVRKMTKEASQLLQLLWMSLGILHTVASGRLHLTTQKQHGIAGDRRPSCVAYGVWTSLWGSCGGGVKSPWGTHNTRTRERIQSLRHWTVTRSCGVLLLMCEHR
jgi:hypothetical protein